MGFFFVQLKPWEERTTAETALERHRQRAEPGVREGDARGGSWPRSARRPSRASAPAPGSRWSCRTGSATRPQWLAAAGGPVHRGGAEAARDRAHLDAVSRERAAGVRRHRPQQGAEGRRAHRRRQHDARRAARQLVRQRLQPLRPRLQGLRPGRARVPDATRNSSACSTCAARRATWCRSTRSCRRGPRAGPSSRTGSTSTARPKSRACRRTATARRRR